MQNGKEKLENNKGEVFNKGEENTPSRSIIKRVDMGFAHTRLSIKVIVSLITWHAA